MADVTDIEEGRAERAVRQAMEKYGVDVEGMAAAFARYSQEQRVEQAVLDCWKLTDAGAPPHLVAERIRATLTEVEARIFNQRVV